MLVGALFLVLALGVGGLPYLAPPAARAQGGGGSILIEDPKPGQRLTSAESKRKLVIRIFPNAYTAPAQYAYVLEGRDNDGAYSAFPSSYDNDVQANAFWTSPNIGPFHSFTYRARLMWRPSGLDPWTEVAVSQPVTIKWQDYELKIGFEQDPSTFKWVARATANGRFDNSNARLALFQKGVPDAIPTTSTDASTIKSVGFSKSEIHGTSWYAVVEDRSASAAGPPMYRVGQDWVDPDAPDPGEKIYTASDFQGPTQGQHGEPVNTATGTFWAAQTDMVLTGRGPAHAVTRTNVSARADQDGPFGYGWSHTYGWRADKTPDGQKLNVTDPDGNVLVIPRNAANDGWAVPARTLLDAADDGAGVKVTTRDRTVYTFAATGELTTITDRNGETLTLAYTDGRLATVTGQSGNTLTYQWTGTHVTKVADAAGREVAYTYDTAGNLTGVDLPGQPGWTYTYDTAHRMLTAKDARSATLTNEYDTTGRVTKQTAPGGGITTYAYSVPFTGGVLTKVTNPDGSRTDYVHGDGGLLLRKTLRANTSSATALPIDYAYDPATRLRTAVIEGGSTSPRATITRYDGRGNPTSTTGPTGATTTTTWNDQDQPLSVTDPAGATTTFKYDTHGNPTKATGPDPSALTGTVSTTFQYGDAAHPGDLTGTTDPAGKTSAVAYDSAGRPATTTDRTGRSVTTGYDSAGRPTTVTVDGKTTTTGYDASGWPATVTDPLSHATATAFDAAGNPVKVTDAAGNDTVLTVDLEGRVTKTATGSKVEETDYDQAGRVVKQRDGAGAETAYAYNATSGLLATLTDPAGRVTTYTWSKYGEVASVKDHAGRTATYLRDAQGQPTRLATTGITTSWTYDPAGRPSSMTDAGGTTTYGYNRVGQLARLGAPGDLADVSWTYDQRGRQIGLTYPGGLTATRTFDEEGRLTGLTDWAGRSHAWTYDAAGRLATRTRPGGAVVTTNVYDDAGRPTSLTTKAGATTVAAFAYQYDQRDALARIIPTGPAVTGDSTRDLAFDPARRLTTDGAKGYGWDTASNLKTMPGQAGRTFATDGRLTAATVDGQAVTYGYSTTGSRTTANAGSATTGYEYDALERLTTFTTPDGTATTYAYDGNGLRRTKTVGPDPVEIFAWDTSGPLPLLLADSTNVYLYGPDGSLVQQTAKSDGTTLYPIRDLTGSVRALVDGAGNVALSRTWDAYGNQTATTGTAISPFGWAGEYRDAESGLTYLRARYYDPATGQFLTRDPLIVLTRDAYGYTFGDPFLRSDPTGLDEGFFGGVRADLKQMRRNYGDAAILRIGALARFANGGSCERYGDMWYCTGGRRLSALGGTTYGDTFIYAGGGEPDPKVMKHERIHTDQWATWGEAFGPIYLIDLGWSHLTTGGPCGSTFEAQAGFAEGNYFQCV